MRHPHAWYESHPRSKYWRKKAIRVWGRIVLKRANYTCCKCGKQATDPHHLLTKGAYLNYAVSLENGIALCRGCHMFHKGSAHGDPEAFTDWLKENRPAQWEWVQSARMLNKKRVLTWMESYNYLIGLEE